MRLGIKAFVILWHSPHFHSIDEISKELNLPVQIVSGYAAVCRVNGVNLRRLPLYSPKTKPSIVSFVDR